MRKIIPWAVGIALIALIAISVSQALASVRNSAKADLFKSKADASHEQSLLDQEARMVAEGEAEVFAAALDRSEADRARDRRLSDERLQALSRDVEAAQRDRRRLLAAEAGNLSPEVMAIVQPVYDSYETEVSGLRDQLAEVEQREQAAEEAVVMAHGETAKWFEAYQRSVTEIRTVRDENASLRVALDARSRRSSKFLGFIPKIDKTSYIAGVVTVVVGAAALK